MIRQAVLTTVLLSLAVVCTSDAAKPSAGTTTETPSPEARQTDADARHLGASFSRPPPRHE